MHIPPVRLSNMEFIMHYTSSRLLCLACAAAFLLPGCASPRPFGKTCDTAHAFQSPIVIAAAFAEEPTPVPDEKHEPASPTGPKPETMGIPAPSLEEKTPDGSRREEPEAVGLNPRNHELDTELPLGIIGEFEPVYIEDIPQSLSARIDTGAAQCSLDAGEIKFFERDGKGWVSFSLTHRDTGEAHQFERRIKRTSQIRNADGTLERRPLVEMKIRIGPETLIRDFTLADRGGLEYQVLIGRNLLSGMAVVDVSRSNTLNH